MNFKEQCLADLDAVFFNDTEFTLPATLNGVGLSVFFDLDRDVMFSGSSGMDTNVAAATPTVTCKRSDAIAAEFGDTVIVNNMTYYIIDIDPPNDGTVKIYLSEDQP